MAEIYLSDLDNNILDEVVEQEATGEVHRAYVAYRELLTAFQTIAGDDLNVLVSNELRQLADIASDEWAERFNSRADRRVVLIRLFPKVTAIIEELKKPQDYDWIPEFLKHVDETGFPVQWDTSMRQHALNEGLYPDDILRMVYHYGSDHILSNTDVEFITRIIQSYQK